MLVLSCILVLALALLAGAATALYQRSRPAMYVSSAVLLIDQPAAVATADSDAPLAKLSRLRYVYADLLTTQTIAQPVARQVHLSVQQVEHSLSAAVDPISFTLVVIARAGNPRQSSLLAQAAATELTSYVQQQQAPLVPTSGQVVLNEVTPPRAGVALAPSERKTVLSGLVAFLVVGAAVTAGLLLLRRRP